MNWLWFYSNARAHKTNGDRSPLMAAKLLLLASVKKSMIANLVFNKKRPKRRVGCRYKKEFSKKQLSQGAFN